MTSGFFVTIAYGCIDPHFIQIQFSCSTAWLVLQGLKHSNLENMVGFRILVL